MIANEAFRDIVKTSACAPTDFWQRAKNYKHKKFKKSVTKPNNAKDSIFSKMIELRFEIIIVKCFFGIKTLVKC